MLYNVTTSCIFMIESLGWILSGPSFKHNRQHGSLETPSFPLCDCCEPVKAFLPFQSLSYLFHVYSLEPWITL